MMFEKMISIVRYLLPAMTVYALLVQSAYPQNYFATMVTHKDGLPDKKIIKIIQDQQGVLWMSSQGGLIRYDGSRYKVYNFDISKEDSIPDNIVESLYINNHDEIFVGTKSGGIAKFKRAFENFTRFSDQIGTVETIAQDDLGVIWVGTYLELQSVSADLELQKRFKQDNSVIHILPVGDEVFFTVGFLRRPNKTFYKISREQQYLIKKDIAISALFSDPLSSTIIWIAGLDGLWKYNIKSGEWHQELSGIRISSAIHSNDGKFIFATREKKLIQYNPSERLIESETDYKDISGIDPKEPLRLLIKDSSGVLWASNEKALVKIQSSNFIKLITPELLKGRWVRSFVEDRQGRFWVGTLRGGLYLWDEDKNLRKVDNPLQAKPMRVYTLYMDNRDVLWVGTLTSLYTYNIANERWNQIELGHDLGVNAIAAMDDGNVLVADVGLRTVDRMSKEMKVFTASKQEGGLHNNSIFNIAAIGGNRYLLSMSAAYSIFDAHKREFKTYSYENSKSLGINKTVKTDVIILNNNDIWVNTVNAGLEKIIGINTEQPQFKSYSIEEGLPMVISYAIINDKQDNIWIAAKKGLLRYQTDKAKIDVFDENNGIKVDEFNYQASYLSKEGLLYFGMKDGMLEIDPSKYNQNDYQPNVIISGVEINHKSALVKPIYSLAFDHNNFKFEFSVLDYRAPNKNNYSYRLEGFDKDWVHAGNRSQTHYTNIPPGEYNFIVRATNSSGLWSEKQANITINIAPPIWKTIWAYLMYVALSLFLLVQFARFRTRRIQRYAEKLENEVGARTKHINELLNSKNELFAHVSHEIRTPLTLMIGPIKKALKISKNPGEYKLLEGALQNGKRLLRMVEQLLTLEKINTPGLLNKECISVVNSIQYVLISVRPLADEKNIAVEFNYDSDANVEMMADAFITIMYNLCVNALKYTGSGGRIGIELKGSDEKVIICVYDNGCGISVVDQKRIFDKFTRVSSAENGVGLGLALVQKIVAVHNGSISVDSEPGLGSRFTVVLPASQDSPQSEQDLSIVRDDNPVFDIEAELNKSECAYLINNNEMQYEDLNDRKTILIIDDTVEMCDYLKLLLEPMCYCSVAHDAASGIALARQEVPDMILCDVMMPGTDGLEVVKTIRNSLETSHVPIIMLTAKGDAETRIKAYTEHADEFITKPFEEEELLSRVKNLFDMREILTQSFMRNAVMQTDTEDFQSHELSKEEKFINNFKKIVANNYHDPGFSLNEMMDLMNISARPLQRKVKSLLGLSPMNYLKKYRLEKASHYLASKDIPIDSILSLVGMPNRSHFYRYFKAYKGCTPMEYRKTCNKELS